MTAKEVHTKFNTQKNGIGSTYSVQELLTEGKTSKCSNSPPKALLKRSVGLASDSVYP